MLQSNPPGSPKTRSLRASALFVVPHVAMREIPAGKRGDRRTSYPVVLLFNLFGLLVFWSSYFTMGISCSCGKSACIKRYSADFCRECFIRVVEKSMKKALRERPLVRGERVVAHGLVREVVEKIVPMPLEFVEEDGIGIVAWSEDDVCAAFIERLFGHEVVVPKGLLLFSHVSDDDLVRYADLCNLSFTPREKPVTWSLFFPLFEKHPDMRRNCARSSTELEFSFEE